tara:strand:- start:29818 stop:30705 length:888 start_codon:yes stop_codon:yes gene_type:complete
MRILISGCSFTFGGELEWQHVDVDDPSIQTLKDLGKRSDFKLRDETRYSHFLAKHYNCDVVNKAKCGASNHWILRSLVEANNKAKWIGSKYDLVIFQMTELSRIDIEYPDNNFCSISASHRAWNNGRGNDVLSKFSNKSLIPDFIGGNSEKQHAPQWKNVQPILQEMSEAYYLHVYSETISIETWWLHQHAFKHIFRDTPYIIIGKRTFENQLPNDVVFKDINDSVDFFLQGKNQILGPKEEDNDRYVKKYKFQVRKNAPNATGGHPSKLGHEIIANKIIEVVNEKYPDLGKKTY